MALSDPLLNKKLGDYTVQSLLGKGGMARVYQGYDEKLDRYAAIKVISGDFASADEDEYKQRFLKEARAIARLSHPNIVGIYQFGDTEGFYYMAMHFLDGEDLRAVLRRYAKKGQRMPTPQFLKMGRDMAEALDYAHKEGVVHRDIKPSNIMMITDGRAVLTDFGLALSVPEGTMGDTFGTAHYIAPEQAISSANAVPQSDLYSLAVVFYEVLTGQVPFDEPSAMSVALKHLNEPPPPPSLLNPDIPRGVERVMLKALAKDPKDRYQTGKELMDVLEGAFAANLDGDTEIALTTPTAPPPPPSTGGVPNSLEYYLKTLEESGSKPPSRPSQPTPPGYVTDMRSPTDMHPPYGTSPYPPSMLYPPPQHRSNTPLIVGIVGLILLVGAVLGYLILSNQNNEDGDTAATFFELQQTQRAIERDETQTAIALFTDTPTPTDTFTPTNTPTDTPTNTPTDTPTNTPTDTPTDTPTNTPTDTPTNTPTDTPTDTPTNTPTDTPTNTPTFVPTEVAIIPPTDTFTPTATPLPPEVQLVYNDESFAIINITEANLDLSDLAFTLVTEEGERKLQLSDLFPVSQLAALPPARCIQLVISPDVANDARVLEGVCNRLQWAAPGQTFIFWVTDSPTASQFSVAVSRNNRERELALCDVVLGIEELTCGFSTQLQRVRPSTDSSLASPTEEATEEPTEAPTRAPSETPQPTDQQPTERPTNTAAPTQTATEAQTATLKLIYTNQAVYLMNISEENEDISQLRFEQEVGDRLISFNAAIWVEQGNATANLAPQMCYQVGVSVGSASNKPSECKDFRFVSRNENAQFWRTFDGGSDTFSIYNGDQKIMDCEIKAGQCNFSLE